MPHYSLTPDQMSAIRYLAKTFQSQPVFHPTAEEGFEIGPVSVCVNETDEIVWYVGTIVFVPGVRYYKDGSGEPDSADVNDDSEHKTFEAAFRRMGELLGLAAADSALESVYWDKEAEEYAQREAEEANFPYSGSF